MWACKLKNSYFKNVNTLRITMAHLKLCVAVAIGFLGMLLYNKLGILLKCISYVLAIAIGILIGLYYVMSQGRVYKSIPKPKEAAIMLKLLMERQNQQASPQIKRQNTVVTRSIDTALDEVLDLMIRDYIIVYIKDLVYDHNRLSEFIKDDLWLVVRNMRDVLAKIDLVKFITNDVINKVCQHYQKIRVSSVGDGRETRPLFMLNPYFQSPETETEFLRKVSEALIVLLLPPSYTRCEPIRHLLREILTCSVLLPTIEQVCDPDYINQKLLSYIQYQQEMLEHHKKTYAYAATYEDFVKMINESTDINHLKRMRYKIVSEIMQATAINNYKKDKGMDVDRELTPQGGHKGDLLQARNLRKYINQLTIAKKQCERKIKYLGGPDYLSPSSSTAVVHEELSPNIPGRKVLSFQVIMENSHARHYFMKFLEKENAQSFLSFWETVEEMKHIDKKNIHEIGNEVYKVYIASSTSPIKLDKSVVKEMETFLTGDKGPDAFFAAQETVAKHLEERHYPCFIVSDVYHKMLKEADGLGIDFMSISTDDLDGNIEESCADNIPLSDHSSHARDKLQQLDERLCNKMQALQALKTSQNAEPKAIVKLEKRIDAMKQERSQLEYHIERTEVWSENLGKWRVQVHTSEVDNEKEKVSPQFMLAVHQMGDDATSSSSEQFVNGWVVLKKVTDFMDLHRSLIQIDPRLKTSELPKEGKALFKSHDKGYNEKAKNMIQAYMKQVTENDNVNRSETLYTFLSPSPELLKQAALSPKKSKSFFSNLFKGNQGSGSAEGSEEEDFLLLDDESSSLKDDPVAEPLYALIGEIFDMRGVFKLLRRTIISFVQITYGRTINRQIRDTVSWLFSESMIVYYIHLFRDAMWPNGVLGKSGPNRNSEEKLKTYYQARQHFVNSIPEVLSNLVGQQNARKGALKVFESLQDVRLNKQILYEILELLLQEVFADYINKAT